MYTIHCDAGIVYNPHLSLIQSDSNLQLSTLGYQSTIIDGELEQATNTAGSLTFTIDASHRLYDTFGIRKTEAWLLDDGEEIFRGRVLDISRNINGSKTIICEGLLAYLRDEQLRPCSTSTASAFFAAIRDAYNAQSRYGGTFTLGTIQSMNAEFKNTGYVSLTDAINQFIDKFGGTVSVKRAGTANVISYTTDAGPLNGQTIAYGENMIDLTEKVSTEELFTVLIPLGKTVDGAPLTIKSVNSNKDYLTASEAILEKYGWIAKTETFSDIDDPAALKTAGQNKLSGAGAAIRSIELTAIDLSMAGADAHALRINQRNRIRHKGMGLDEILPLTRLRIPILTPENAEYIFGQDIRTFTKTA